MEILVKTMMSSKYLTFVKCKIQNFNIEEASVSEMGGRGYNLSDCPLHWTHLAIMMIFRTTMMILLGVMITFGRFSYSHLLALNLFLFHSYLSCCSL